MSGPAPELQAHVCAVPPEPDWREKRRLRVEARAKRIAEREQKQSKQEAKKTKEQRRLEKQARVNKRREESLAMGGETPEVAKVEYVQDPLKIYDRHGTDTHHALRGLWQDCAAFYVCGGPSLKLLDLAFLKDRGVLSLGINNVAAVAHVRAWAFSDPPEKFHHGIFLDPTILKFVPRPKLGKRVRAKIDGKFRWTSYEVKHCPSVFGFDREGKLEIDTFLTTEYASWGRSGKHAEYKAAGVDQLFTFYIGLRLLHYLGVKRVYLLGVDFQMGGQHGFYAFGSDRHDGAAACNNSQYVKAARLLGELRPRFEAAGFEIFQTNEQSALKVFDYVPLADAIADCKGVLQVEPLDCDRYYDKLKNGAEPEQHGTGTDERGED